MACIAAPFISPEIIEAGSVMFWSMYIVDIRILSVSVKMPSASFSFVIDLSAILSIDRVPLVISLAECVCDLAALLSKVVWRLLTSEMAWV